MNSFLGYVGGKSRLVKQLLPLIPDHKTYVEVFAGAAWLLFAKEPSTGEVINDINGELVNLYRVVKNNFDEFCEQFKWQLIARDEYERFKHLDPATLSDVERAVRIYYLLKCGYGYRMNRFNFCMSPNGHPPAFNPANMEKNLLDIHKRLSRVWIENSPYEKIIKKFNGEKTFFYIDPPYLNGENDYGSGIFDINNYYKLKELLSNAKGKFLLSVNDAPEIREIFKDFNLKEVQTMYSVQNGTRGNIQELLFANYDLEPAMFHKDLIYD